MIGVKDKSYIRRSYYLKVHGNPIVWNLITLFFVALVFIFLVWSYRTEFSEITYATGEVVTSKSVIKVQHLDGGAISEILIKNGDFVKEGAHLLSLDVKDLIVDRSKLQNNLVRLKKKKGILKERVKMRSKLLKKGLNSKVEFLAEVKAANDVDIDIEAHEAELNLLNKKIERSKIFSNATGTIHNLQFEGVGEVIRRGETIFEIYPESNSLEAEIKISPDDIGHIEKGDDVILKFNTYDFSRYGGLEEKILSVSTSTYFDGQGRPYYRARTSIKENYLGNEQSKILPGMTLTGEIKTGEKSVLNYLLKPLYYISDRAMTEK